MGSDKRQSHAMRLTRFMSVTCSMGTTCSVLVEANPVHGVPFTDAHGCWMTATTRLLRSTSGILDSRMLLLLHFR